jgi:hypothetical protein
MKSTEEYLDDYFDKYNELLRKDELWRIRVKPEEFIKKVERVRANGIEARKDGKLTEYHIERNEEAFIAVTLMDRVTLEEKKEQAASIRKINEERYLKEAPRVQEYVKQLKIPLNKNDVIELYKALWAKQITLEIIPEEVLAEFKQTQQYEVLFGK